MDWTIIREVVKEVFLVKLGEAHGDTSEIEISVVQHCENVLRHQPHRSWV